MVQRRRRLGDNQESGGSTPPGITLTKGSVGVSAAHLLGTEEDAVQLRDGPLDTGRWSKGKTLGLHPGNRGSSPRRSTGRTWADGPMGRRQFGELEIRVRVSVGPLTIWKVVGYGWPSRFAKPCPVTGMWVQIPCLPLRHAAIPMRGIMPRVLNRKSAPMVKWKSCLGSNEVVRVRFLVGVLKNLYLG